MTLPQSLKGRYDIHEILGEGGMGVVYRAYDTVLKCNVAMKMIRDTPDPPALQLFYRECEVLTGLNHPNIVPILDLGEFEQEGQMRPFFVMPLLPGATLDRLMKDAGQLTVERSIDVLTQVCRGLSAAHEKGLVHRDLKPGNIFVMPDDSVEIIDFGVAHMTSTEATVGRKGTLLFMAPELLDMKPPSPLSDIFALGVMAYQMFSRRRPFERPTESEIVDAILRETPPSISDLNPNVNQAISRVVHKAIAKQPWNRFSTARDFADCLQKAYRGEQIEYFDPNRIRPRVERAKKAFEQGDYQFASEILVELDAEGHLDPQMSQIRRQIDVVVRHKRVKQLLESARTRLEEDECPLALRKVQEALSLEPESAEALGLKAEIESASSEHQMDAWFHLVREHMDNSAYSHAREALGNVLQIQPQDTRAKALMAEVDRQEQDHQRARKDKEGLYHAAVEEFQIGEVSSALGKLEKVLEIDRKVPDRISTDRSATYQNFYNEVRLEYDSMRSSYADARKYLDDQNFAKALDICDQFLVKFPGHALFQALKFDVEEKQRQRLSSFVAEVDRRVEADADLERKENILEEALVQFPGEPHFESALKLIRNRLSLVNQIVSKARFHEEKGKFSEALGQWEILNTIHGKYPGLDFEMERLNKRRNQQVRGEAKAQWVEKIDGHLEAAEFDRALEAVQGGLQEFPDESELLALQNQASQGVERQREAQRALAEGNTLFEQGQFEEGIAALNRARYLDQRSPAIRSALTSKLVERARQLTDSDWRAASALVDQALELEPGQAAAKSVRILLEDRRREEFVDQAVAQIRGLQTAGDVAGALAHVEQSLSFFPSEPRLIRLQGVLKSAVAESETARMQAKDLDQVRGLAAGAEPLATPGQLQEVATLVGKIGAKYPSNFEYQTVTGAGQRRYRTVAQQSASAETETLRFPPAARQLQTPTVRRVPLTLRWADYIVPALIGIAVAALAFALAFAPRADNAALWLEPALLLVIGVGVSRYIQKRFRTRGTNTERTNVAAKDRAGETTSKTLISSVEFDSSVDIAESSVQRPGTSADGTPSERTLLFQTVPSTSRYSPARPPPEGLAATEASTQILTIGDAAKESPRPSIPFTIPDVAVTITACTEQVWIGRTFRVQEFPVRLGRSGGLLRLPFDPAISGEHAELDFSNGDFTLRDLGSKNGTFLNGRRLSPLQSEALFFGARIILGSNTELTFVSNELEELPALSGKLLVGRYELREKISERAKSVVYQALDTKLSLFVVVKILSPRLTRYPGYRAAFEREARVACEMLRHEHINRVLDCGEALLGATDATRVLYIVMEYLGGGNLEQRLCNGEPIGLELIAEWLRKIADALNHVHKQGLVHAGIKPSAILFDGNEPYLTDFAQAVKAGEKSHPLVISTPAFLAPEQWVQGSLLPVTDQYSLAVVFYLVLTGSLPYEGQEHVDIRRRNFLQPPLSAHAMAARNNRFVLPLPVSLVLQKAMSEKPEDRYSTILAFVEAFRHALLSKPARVPRSIKVFFSYRRRASAAWVNLLKVELEAKQGFTVVYDVVQLGTGPFLRNIEHEIKSCKVFVCLLAEDTLKSEWVNREIELAYAARKPMVPVFQEDFRAPSDIGNLSAPVQELLTQSAIRLHDHSNTYVQEAIQELAHSIREAAGRSRVRTSARQRVNPE
jgi:serine/threonine protein kinase